MATAIFPFTALEANGITLNGTTGETVGINAEEVHYAQLDDDGNIILDLKNYDSLTFTQYLLDGTGQTLNTLMALIIGADPDTSVIPVIIFEKDNQTITPPKTVLLNRAKILEMYNTYDVNEVVNGTVIHYSNNPNDHFSVINTTFNLLDTSVYS